MAEQEKRTLITREALAARRGVTTRTITSYVQSGCPTHEVDGKQLFWLEEAEEWLDAHGLTGKPGRPRSPQAGDTSAEASLPSRSEGPVAPGPRPAVPSFERAPLSTKDVKERADAARKIAAAKKEEHELEQERGLEQLDLAERIRKVTTPDELIGLSLEVMALVGEGRMKHQRGQALRQLLGQAQKAMSARTVETAEEQGTFLVSRQARELAQAFDKLGNGWRRRWIVEAVRLHREQDRIEIPGWDGDMLPILRALEIDAMGEPLSQTWPVRFAAPVVPPAVVEIALEGGKR